MADPDSDTAGPRTGGRGSVAVIGVASAGYTVQSERVTGSKESRADPFSAQVNAGNVRMVKVSWNAAVIEELRTFPGGKMMIS